MRATAPRRASSAKVRHYPVDDDNVANLARRSLARSGGARRGERDAHGQENRKQRG